MELSEKIKGLSKTKCNPVDYMIVLPKEIKGVKKISKEDTWEVVIDIDCEVEEDSLFETLSVNSVCTFSDISSKGGIDLFAFNEFTDEAYFSEYSELSFDTFIKREY